MCIEGKIEIANKKLITSYNRALTDLRKESPEFEDSFHAAQRAWLKYKDAQCELTGGISTDSPWQGVQIEICKLNMTLKRIDYLKLFVL